MIKNTVVKIGYRFDRLGFYYLAVKHDIEDKNGNIFKIIFRNTKLFNYKNGYYEYLEVPITTRCSLRCKNCANLISCYKKPTDYDLAVIKKSVTTFLECINRIVYVRIMGGEPFLSKNLYEVLKLVLKSDKIQRIEVVTNGTIVPDDPKLLKVLRNNKVVISISEYPIVNRDKLIKKLEDNNIKYRIDKMNYWMSYGNTKKRNRTEKELKKQFAKCNNFCRSIVNGELHMCPRSSHGTDLGIIKNNERDYINLLDDSLTIEEKKQKINELFKCKYIMACDYCDYGTDKCKKIPVAEQLKK